METPQLDQIGLSVDLRLCDVWAMLFERGGIDALDDDLLGWMLRLAYVTGYWDALAERQRGALCAELGYPIPVRPTS